MNSLKFKYYDTYTKKIYRVRNMDWGGMGDNLTLCHIHLDVPQDILKEYPGLGSEIVAHSDELMQYIGLKDKNGKELYDGDVISVNKGDYIDPHGIDYPTNKVLIFEIDMNDLREFPEIYCDFEIIGNTHENKDLLDNKT